MKSMDAISVSRLFCVGVLALCAVVLADTDWSVSDTSLTFISYEGSEDSEDLLLTLTNDGDSTFRWTIYDANELTLTLPDWMNMTPQSGSVSADKSSYIIVQADATGLSAGDYEYVFDIVDTTDTSSREHVTVLLEVQGPVLEVSADTFEFPFDEDSYDTEQTLTLENTGGGTAAWSAHDPNETTLTLPDWLTIDPVSGNLSHDETEDILLTVDKAGLARGEHSFGFDISAEDADSDPIRITVLVDITGVIYVPSHYETIQEAIDAAVTDDVILVDAGIYTENISFGGKDVVVMAMSSYDPDEEEFSYINGNGDGAVVTFNGQETSACVLKGFVIYNGYKYGAGGGISGAGTEATIDTCVLAANIAYWGGGMCACNGEIINCQMISNAAYYDGGGMAICDGTITNCTIANNIAALEGGGLFDCQGTIQNCIIWGNEASGATGVYDGEDPTYSCIQDWEDGGTGNITSNPLFADSDNDDYHLKSQYGRWDPNQGFWVYDSTTSPCIDGGFTERLTYVDANDTPSDPNDDFEVEYTDPNAAWMAELWPHGERLNMGAYGGTSQASMSADPTGNLANLNHDELIDVNDLQLFLEDWLIERNFMDSDLDRDGVVDVADFALFSEQWQSPVELTPPPSPTGLTLTAGELQVDLDWDDSDYEYFSYYNVYRAEEDVEDANNIQLLVSDLTDSQYTDPNLSDGTAYYYMVTVVSTFDGESEYSDVVSVEFEGPSAPTGLTTVEVSEEQVELDWDDSEYTYFASYNIYRSDDPNDPELLESGLTESEYIDDSVTGGSEYYYMVTVVSEYDTESEYSEVVYAHPPYSLTDHFEASFGNWSNVDDDDDTDWIRQAGTTSSSGTGPSSGADGTSRYVYVEGGYVAGAGKVAILEGPEIDGIDRQMTFYYHMYGDDMGTLNVDVYYDDAWQEGVWSLSGQQQTSSDDDYIQATVDLSSYTGVIIVRFRFVSIGGYATDIAIDEIEITGVQ